MVGGQEMERKRLQDKEERLRRERASKDAEKRKKEEERARQKAASVRKEEEEKERLRTISPCLPSSCAPTQPSTFCWRRERARACAPRPTDRHTGGHKRVSD